MHVLHGHQCKLNPPLLITEYFRQHQMYNLNDCISLPELLAELPSMSLDVGEIVRALAQHGSQSRTTVSTTLQSILLIVMRLQWGAVHFETAAASLAPLRSVCS